MNTIETSTPVAPEKQKRIDAYDGRKQDHGTRNTYRPKDKIWEQILIDGRVDGHMKAELSNVDATVSPDEGLFEDEDSFFSLTDYESLEAAADFLLGEKPMKPAIESISPSKEKENIRDVVSDALEQNDESELKYLYKVLSRRHREIEVELSANDTTSELADLADFIEDHLDILADAINDEHSTDTEDRVVSKAELGLPDKRFIIQQMARRVTLDPEYAEDDMGDNDIMPGIHTTDRT